MMMMMMIIIIIIIIMMMIFHRECCYCPMASIHCKVSGSNPVPGTLILKFRELIPSQKFYSIRLSTILPALTNSDEKPIIVLYSTILSGYIA